MTVEQINWPGVSGRDLHLLPGLVSPRLDQLLYIADSSGTVRADTPPPGVTVTFAAQLSVDPATVGVPLDPATGEIEITAPLPPPTSSAPRVRSFIVDATVTDPNAGTSFTTSIRVLVHERLVRVWPTPRSLTVRQGAGNMRFTVLAEFDDGTIGDITNWAPFGGLDPARRGDRTYVHASGSADPQLFWSLADADAGIDVDAASGELYATASVGGSTVNVSPRSFPGTGGDAGVRCAPPWGTPLSVDLVAGPGFDAMGDPDVRNVLFLPDGFDDTTADRDGFERLVRVIVGRLAARRRTRPWDLLKGKINYFTAYLPSPDQGISVLDELDRQHPPTIALPMEAPARPKPTVNLWSLPELLYVVGPPTPAHDPPGTPLAAQLPDWNVLYGGPVPVTAALAGGMYPDWLARADRVLLNERNTAFHTAMGYRPSLAGLGTDRDLRFHPLRLQTADFELFLAGLQDDGAGQEVGATWCAGGKDDDLVVLLSRTTRNAGSNNPRTGDPGRGHYVCMSLYDDPALEIEAARRGRGFDVQVAAVPSRVISDTWMTVAHELAHSLSIGDEYGGQPGPVPRSTLDDVATRTNVQSPTLLQGTGGLTTTLLQWAQWLRIVAAGVLTANPVPLPDGNFTVTLQPGHARAFRDQDIVRLRTRPLVTSADLSGRLTVVGDPAGDTLTLMPRAGSRLHPIQFPAGSIVMVPLRLPDQGTVLGDELKLAARSILDLIDLKHNPLNALYKDPPNRACPGIADSATPATLFPDQKAPRPPRYSSWIVGLYEGGAGYDCGIYRPTGICIMRVYAYVPIVSIRADGTHVPSPRVRASEFCPVCRYAMVDQLDPAQHGRIDRDYAPRYPA
jgi:hypothetical protein